MFSLIRQLCAPERHPIPRREDLPKPSVDDSIEVIQGKIEKLVENDIKIKKAQMWFARLSGWHQALFSFATVNFVLLMYSLFVESIPGEYYGFLLALLTLFMGLCAKRLVKLS